MVFGCLGRTRFALSGQPSRHASEPAIGGRGATRFLPGLLGTRRGLMRRWPHVIVGLVLLCAIATTAGAQSAGPQDTLGIVPHHGSFSQFPWEHVDTYTGNVTLSFTDLVLPGNAGFSLVVHRTLNSKGFLWHWSVGPELVFVGGDAYPRVIRPDGNEMRFFKTDTLPAPLGVYVSASFWRLTISETARTLEMPTGLVCHFNAGGHLTEMHDPFGNRVEVAYRANGWQAEHVVQYVGTET